MKLEEVILRDARASQPAANTVPAGTLFYVTDENVTERSTGSAWEDYSDVSAVADGDKGDITVSGSGATWTIDNEAVTYAKIQDVADGRLLGNFSGGAAAPSEYSLGAGVEHNGGAIRTKAAIRTFTKGITIDGGGATITTGVKGYVTVPWTGTITGVRLLADQNGAIVIDVWKDTYANYPPTDADSITAAAPPTITASGNKSEDTTLTGWTTSVTAGDVLGFNVDSVTSIQRVTLELTIVVTG